MFQPEVKLKFVERYCNPKNGWEVFVDIDASEEGRTGGERKTLKAKSNQEAMRSAAESAIKRLKELSAQVGGSRKEWTKYLRDKYPEDSIPEIPGDRDIIAFNIEKNSILVAEVEGDSSGQPETKAYKAIGQIIIAVSETKCDEWNKSFIIVVHNKQIAKHVARATTLKKLDISGLQLGSEPKDDRWLFA